MSQQSEISQAGQSGRRRQAGRLLVVAGVLISAFFLYFAFRGLQPEAFISSLQNVNILWLLVSVVFMMLSMIAIAWRWQFVLRGIQLIDVRALTEIVLIGYMGNNLYPLRAGEALRAYLLKRTYGVSFAGSTTTILVERVFDGVVMLGFIAIGLLASNIQANEINLITTVAIPVFGMAMLVLVLVAQFPQLARRIIHFFTGLLPAVIGQKLNEISENVLDGLTILSNLSRLLWTIFASVLTWGIQGVVYWQVMWAFGLTLEFPVALLVVGVVNLVGLIPASPGQVGVFEFFVSRVMIGAGIAEDVALAYAVVVHIIVWLPVTVSGFFFLVRQGLGWNAVAEARQVGATSA